MAQGKRSLLTGASSGIGAYSTSWPRAIIGNRMPLLPTSMIARF